MKSFLVHIASFAVIFHMTFGCSMHHGLGSANACVSQSGLSTCCHVEPIECDDHEDYGHDSCCHGQESPYSQSPVNFENDGSNHNHGHLGCHDDGCSVTKVDNYVSARLDLFTSYLGGAEDSAVATTSSYPGFACEPFPDCSPTALKLRLHLLLGVQIL